MSNNYDTIAPYYDILSRMVFFRTQVKAQIDQLAYIPPESQVLIVGGGTGWVLEEMAKIHPSGLAITYVEISAKMLDISRKRNVKDNMVRFVHSSAEEFEKKQEYDVIITAFLFDNFTAEKIDLVFGRLNDMLKPGGFWLFCDFYYNGSSGSNWKWYLLKTMYLFFNKISDVEAKALIDTSQHFISNQYESVKTGFYYSGFIKAIVYRKI